jgi:large subunit ribosomal protein L21
MYAVIRAGGKQYRVAPGDVIKIERFGADQNKNGKINFDVLAVSPEAGKITRPNGSAATVTGEVMEDGRAAKILVFKFKRKKQYKKMIGHRQNFTAVRITEIAFEGNKATAPALEKKEKKAKPQAEAKAAPKKAAAHHDTPSKKLAAAHKKKATAKKTTAKKAAKKSSKKK